MKRSCWTIGSWRSCLSLEVVRSIPSGSTIIYRFLCGFICVSLCQSIKIKPNKYVYVCVYVYVYAYTHVCVYVCEYTYVYAYVYAYVHANAWFIHIMYSYTLLYISLYKCYKCKYLALKKGTFGSPNCSIHHISRAIAWDSRHVIVVYRWAGCVCLSVMIQSIQNTWIPGPCRFNRTWCTYPCEPGFCPRGVNC